MPDFKITVPDGLLQHRGNAKFKFELETDEGITFFINGRVTARHKPVKKRGKSVILKVLPPYGELKKILKDEIPLKLRQTVCDKPVNYELRDALKSIGLPSPPTLRKKLLEREEWKGFNDLFSYSRRVHNQHMFI